MAPTPTALRAACRRIKNAALADEIDYAIARAEINADDTVHRERAATLDDWPEIFARTLGGITTYPETTAAARQWFADRGIFG